MNSRRPAMLRARSIPSRGATPRNCSSRGSRRERPRDLPRPELRPPEQVCSRGRRVSTCPRNISVHDTPPSLHPAGDRRRPRICPPWRGVGCCCDVREPCLAGPAAHRPPVRAAATRRTIHTVRDLDGDAAHSRAGQPSGLLPGHRLIEAALLRTWWKTPAVSRVERPARCAGQYRPSGPGGQRSVRRASRGSRGVTCTRAAQEGR